ncbi:MAG: hypothetical protein DSY76_00565 [Bacteroidetes bacterium]|nr:MAG: hypothetical protein DSY76_00565 [Bacteroidota bacterium]
MLYQLLLWKRRWANCEDKFTFLGYFFIAIWSEDFINNLILRQFYSKLSFKWEIFVKLTPPFEKGGTNLSFKIENI